VYTILQQRDGWDKGWYELAKILLDCQNMKQFVEKEDVTFH